MKIAIQNIILQIFIVWNGQFFLKASVYRTKKFQKRKKTSISGYTYKTQLYGTADVNSDTDEGMVIEFSIPKKYFEAAYK